MFLCKLRKIEVILSPILSVHSSVAIQIPLKTLSMCFADIFGIKTAVLYLKKKFGSGSSPNMYEKYTSILLNLKKPLQLLPIYFFILNLSLIKPSFQSTPKMIFFLSFI